VHGAGGKGAPGWARVGLDALFAQRWRPSSAVRVQWWQRHGRRVFPGWPAEGRARGVGVLRKESVDLSRDVIGVIVLVAVIVSSSSSSLCGEGRPPSVIGPRGALVVVGALVPGPLAAAEGPCRSSKLSAKPRFFDVDGSAKPLRRGRCCGAVVHGICVPADGVAVALVPTDEFAFGAWSSVHPRRDEGDVVRRGFSIGARVDDRAPMGCEEFLVSLSHGFVMFLKRLIVVAELLQVSLVTPASLFQEVVGVFDSSPELRPKAWVGKDGANFVAKEGVGRARVCCFTNPFTIRRRRRPLRPSWPGM